MSDNKDYANGSKLSKEIDRYILEFFPEIDSDVYVEGQIIPRRPLKAHETYLQETLIAQTQVSTVCSQMELAAGLLSGYRSRLHKSDDNKTRFDYILYHIENHFVRAGMVLDRALKLTNIVFRLGIPDRQCRFSVVAKNDYVKDTATYSKLVDLTNATKRYQEQRNIVLHRETYSDKELNSLRLFYHLEVHHPETAARMAHFYKRKTDMYIRKNKRRMGKDNATISSKVFDLYDVLAKVFKQNYEGLLNEG